MATLELIHMVVLAAFGGLLVWAAYTDFGKFVIPNIVSIALVALYPAYVLTAPGETYWAFAIFMAVVVFLVGFFMFALGVMGGGDVKLMSACMLWAGPQYLIEFFGAMIAMSVVLAVYAAVRMAIAMQNEQNGDAPGADGAAAKARNGGSFKWVFNLRYVPLTKLNVPYGVAIATGGLTFLVFTVIAP